MLHGRQSASAKLGFFGLPFLLFDTSLRYHAEMISFFPLDLDLLPLIGSITIIFCLRAMSTRY